MEGCFRPNFPIKIEIALYDYIILQLERELACIKEIERDLNNKWYHLVMKSMN